MIALHQIDMYQMSEEFHEIFQAAVNHLQRSLGARQIHWLKARAEPPYLEHLSFRIGSQLFFVRVTDESDQIQGPSSIEGLLRVARGSNGHACLMPMRRDRSTGDWHPVSSGSGLVDLASGKPLTFNDGDFSDLVLMTPWEQHDMSVGVVRAQLEKNGYQIMSSCGDPDIKPSVWFIGDSGRPEWVIVKSHTFPDGPPEVSDDEVQEISGRTSEFADLGHFAPVGLVNANDLELPLVRGAPMYVRYEGLEKVFGDTSQIMITRRRVDEESSKPKSGCLGVAAVAALIPTVSLALGYFLI